MNKYFISFVVVYKTGTVGYYNKIKYGEKLDDALLDEFACELADLFYNSGHITIMNVVKMDE